MPDAYSRIYSGPDTALREREQVSQRVFAYHLNISKESVSQWERGEKRPAGPSLKLLALIKRKGLAAIA